MIRITAYRAIDDLETSKAFLLGHSQSLSHHNILNVDSAHEKWLSNPFVYIVVAESGRDKKLLCGARVHVADEKYPLPLIDAVSQNDPKVSVRVNNYLAEGVGELCGLWGAKDIKGKVLSDLILLTFRSIIIISTQIRAQNIFGLYPRHTSRLGRRFGFIVDTSLGDDGHFSYPTPKFKSMIGYLNTHTLAKTEGVEKRSIIELRTNLRQNRLERIGDEELSICYNLSLNNK